MKKLLKGIIEQLTRIATALEAKNTFHGIEQEEENPYWEENETKELVNYYLVKAYDDFAHIKPLGQRIVKAHDMAGVQLYMKKFYPNIHHSIDFVCTEEDMADVTY